MGRSRGCAVAELQVSEVSRKPRGFRGSVRIYASDQCPRQDSNLRSRLRRALLCTALTWPSVLNEASWGAYGGSAGYELLDQDTAASSTSVSAGGRASWWSTHTGAVNS